VYRVEEFAFDAACLREQLRADLIRSGVSVRLRANVVRLEPKGDMFEVGIDEGDGRSVMLRTRLVFNCTYSGLNHVGFTGGECVRTQLKHEIAELGLIRPPMDLARVGVTVMDGQFFSTMPFPALGLHTLSHVRYTPHCFWMDDPKVNPYSRLDGYARESRLDRMLRDVCRWMPCMSDAKPEGTLFEVKTVLVRNESDDGRPILFERNCDHPGLFSVLGGKIDNVYDILERLRLEVL
jgi:hypothetical protein